MPVTDAVEKAITQMNAMQEHLSNLNMAIKIYHILSKMMIVRMMTAVMIIIVGQMIVITKCKSR
jgi:hypothetical protein